jgi:hypothetical protein
MIDLTGTWMSDQKSSLHNTESALTPRSQDTHSVLFGKNDRSLAILMRWTGRFATLPIKRLYPLEVLVPF